MLQDKRFKNRELHIMRQLKHENVVDLKYFFYSNGSKVGIQANLVFAPACWLARGLCVCVKGLRGSCCLIMPQDPCHF